MQIGEEFGTGLCVCLFYFFCCGHLWDDFIVTRVKDTSVLFFSFFPPLFHFKEPTVSAAGGSWHTPATGFVCVCVCA